jgi:transglutaminase/protease-like cytokinesis protein 3
MKMPGLLSAILLPALLYAQKPAVRSNPYAETDARALQLPDSSSHDVSRIAAYINANFTTATVRTRAIFIWIANNIQYDIDNMFAIDFYEDSAGKVDKPLRTRKGICENYAALFAAICNQTGIRSYVIQGYTKRRGFVDYIPHAWCAVWIDGNWWLMDPTRGSGYVEQGKFVRKVNETCFKAGPDAFIRSHIPFDYLWEFLYYPVTNQEFYEGRTAPDSKSKSGRRSMFYKTTIFGMPIN